MKEGKIILLWDWDSESELSVTDFTSIFWESFEIEEA